METTIVHYNGSKWAGEPPDSIEILIERLGFYTLESRFFSKNIEQYKKNPKKFLIIPICKQGGMYQFFGNFEEISGCFRIDTNDPEVIGKLKPAILNNKGWKKYIHQCKYVSK